MKKALLTALLISAFSAPAFAQAVEKVPLSTPSYTINKETDPMATDSSSAEPAKSVNKGETIIAPPPPGDTSQQEDQQETVPAPSNEPTPILPTPANTSNGEVAPPPKPFHSNVTGLTAKDETKFEKMKFCTIKVSFSSKCCGTDKNTGNKIKEWLDGNSTIAQYTQNNWGKEGEYDYCIDVPEHNNRAKTYAALKNMLPSKGANSSSGGDTTLSGKGFATVKTRD